MRKDTSPEERLLALIKNKDRKGVSAPGQPAGEGQGGRDKADSASKGARGFGTALRAELFRNKLFEPATLKSVNMYLAIVLCGALAYLLADLAFIKPYKNIKSLVSRTVAEEALKTAGTQVEPAAMARDYNSYSSVISGKSVFGQPQGQPQGPSGDIALSGDISDTIGLVGIVAGDSPQAIIEDKKSNKTYYLIKGQSFNGYLVDEILEDRVILDCDGKKTSLFL